MKHRYQNLKEQYREWRETSEVWQECRRKVWKRDKGTCQVCGTTKGERHVHHVSYAQWDNIDLMKLVCAACHDDIHDATPLSCAALEAKCKAFFKNPATSHKASDKPVPIVNAEPTGIVIDADTLAMFIEVGTIAPDPQL